MGNGKDCSFDGWVMKDGAPGRAGGRWAFVEEERRAWPEVRARAHSRLNGSSLSTQLSDLPHAGFPRLGLAADLRRVPEQMREARPPILSKMCESHSRPFGEPAKLCPLCQAKVPLSVRHGLRDIRSNATRRRHSRQTNLPTPPRPCPGSATGSALCGSA